MQQNLILQSKYPKDFMNRTSLSSTNQIIKQAIEIIAETSELITGQNRSGSTCCRGSGNENKSSRTRSRMFNKWNKIFT